MSTEFEQSGDLRPGLFPEETAEEAVARIVAQNPQKHGVPLAEREHRLIEQTRRIAAETQAFFDASDTVEEAGNVKDHETGEKEEADKKENRLQQMDAKNESGIPAASIVAGQDGQSVVCDHKWPEDPDEDTRCPLCQMTFADWVNS